MRCRCCLTFGVCALQRTSTETSVEACAFDRRDKVMVGVNKYQVPEERPIPILKIDPDIERTQSDRVRAWKKGRNVREAREATLRVRDACANGENVMPPILAAVKKGVTVGEISDVFRETFGEYRDPAWL